MNILYFTKPKALMTGLVALVFVIYPQVFFMLLETNVTPVGEMMTRILGGAYLATALSLWSINSNSDISVKDAYLYSLGDIIGGLAIGFAIVEIGLNTLAILLCTVYLICAGAFFAVAKEVSANRVE